MSYVTETGDSKSRFWVPDSATEVGPYERSPYPVECNGCRRRLKRVRPVVINRTEFTYCDPCIRELAGILLKAVRK